MREEQRFALDGLDLAGSDRNIASHAPRSSAKVDVSADLLRGRDSLEGCANRLGGAIWNMTEVPLRLVVGRVSSDHLSSTIQRRVCYAGGVNTFTPVIRSKAGLSDWLIALNRTCITRDSGMTTY